MSLGTIVISHADHITFDLDFRQGLYVSSEWYHLTMADFNASLPGEWFRLQSLNLNVFIF